jgi:hypothetical protein
MSTPTCFGYIISHHRFAQTKIRFDPQLQNVVRDLKFYSEFIHKISIKYAI